MRFFLNGFLVIMFFFKVEETLRYLVDEKYIFFLNKKVFLVF